MNFYDILLAKCLCCKSGGASPCLKSASGDIITITDGADNMPLFSAVVNIEPVQSGSGDPSPSNIRPISGRSEAKVWVKPTYDTTLTPTATIALGQTVYGGTLDVVRGKLTLTHAKITLNGTQTISLANWRPSATGVGWLYSQSELGNKVYTSDQAVQSIVSDKLKTVNYATAFGANQDNIISSVAQTNGISSYGLAVRVSDTSLTTSAAINTYLAANPIDAVYPFATPIEVDLTPQTIKTLLGVNNIWADAGSMEIEYVAVS